MIKLASIGHVLLRVTDEEASKRFYRDVLGFRVAEQDPEHGGVFMTLGDGFHTLDITQPRHPQTRSDQSAASSGSCISPSRSTATPHCATRTPTS